MSSTRDRSGLGYLLDEVSDAPAPADAAEGARPDPLDPVAGEVRGPAAGHKPTNGELDLDDNRRHARLPMEFDVLFERGSEHVRARGSNLSRGGMFVSTRRPLGEGDVVSASLYVGQREIKIIAEVMWERSDDPTGVTPCGMGLKFLDIEDEDADFVDSLVAD